ncbi:MAG: alpha/beta hydrolase [Chitinophagaceae bacterium]|nr:alpha/beta hydrolase [Chitinophagaceae bacterium]
MQHKAKWKRNLGRIGWWVAGIYLLLVITLMVGGLFVQFRSSDAEVLKYYHDHKLNIDIHRYMALGREMRYLSTGADTSKPTILFIHGAPSSSSYYRHFLNDTALRAKANLLAVDRPGYGYSGFGEPEPDMARQAAMIAPILQNIRKTQPHQSVMIVAASYGTSIAARLQMDFPELADGLLLIAPSLAPGQEKTYWVSYVLESPLFSWAQPRMLHSANVEKFSHHHQLEQMRHRWHEIEVPVIYLQGEKDDLIYTSNALFAQKHITRAKMLSIRMIPNRGHLLIYDEAPRIRRAITEMLGQSAGFFARHRQGFAQIAGQKAKAPHF